MISKELLSEILSVKIARIEKFEDIIDYGFYSKDEPGRICSSTINIHKLVYKCKKWARYKGFMIGTDLDRINIWSIKDRIILNHYEVYPEDYMEFEVKACEWILNGKN